MVFLPVVSAQEALCETQTPNLWESGSYSMQVLEILPRFPLTILLSQLQRLLPSKKYS